jgi:hypothetical protein
MTIRESSDENDNPQPSAPMEDELYSSNGIGNNNNEVLIVHAEPVYPNHGDGDIPFVQATSVNEQYPYTGGNHSNCNTNGSSLATATTGSASGPIAMATGPARPSTSFATATGPALPPPTPTYNNVQEPSRYRDSNGSLTCCGVTIIVIVSISVCCCLPVIIVLILSAASWQYVSLGGNDDYNNVFEGGDHGGY